MYLVELFRLRIFTLPRLARLVWHVITHGIQLGNVVHMCADRNAIAIKHRGESLTYSTLFSQIASVAGYIHQQHKVKQGSRILFIADNSIPSVVTLTALSSLGCNIDIMGTIRDYNQFKRTVDVSRYDLIVSATETALPYYDEASIIFITSSWLEAISHIPYKPFVRVSTSIVIFTSGSTSTAKKARRNNTLWQYLIAIADLVKTMKLNSDQNVLLPVPIYHSYGLSVLFLSMMMNNTVSLQNKFDADEVARAIESDGIQVVVVIPQMLSKLISFNLRSLRCIISCADILPTRVLNAARKSFGDIIFNLYGTTEAGLSTIATPEMLAINPDTIGRAINGNQLVLIEESGNSILYVNSRFGIGNKQIRTGDIATVDENGWYYLKGRVDDLCVINGVNVYPSEVIAMAYENDGVQHAVMKCFKDTDGFSKIKLTLRSRDGIELTEERFKQWWIETHGTKHFPSKVEVTHQDDTFKLM